MKSPSKCDADLTGVFALKYEIKPETDFKDHGYNYNENCGCGKVKTALITMHIYCFQN
jgi:hypothetical protein